MGLFGKKKGKRSNSRLRSGGNNSSEFMALTRPQALFLDFIKDPLVKRLVNQLALQQDEEGFKSITLVSELAGEGRTFVTAALALGFASFLKKRVLIVDTVSRSRTESFFSLALHATPLQSLAPTNSSAGSVELMTTQSEESRLNSVGSHSDSRPSHPTLDYQSNDQSSPADSPDLMPVTYRPSFFSETAEFQLGNLITAVSPSYDLILIDTCAFSSAKKSALDPIVLAKQTDGVLLITTKGTLGREALVRMKAQLSQSRLKIYGTIFNKPVKVN